MRAGCGRRGCEPHQPLALDRADGGHCAERWGPRHVQIVNSLLDAGADVHIAEKEGITPLQHALDRGYAEIVVLLRQAGAQR